MALITNKNNPKVNTVTGKVNNTKTGFTKKLSKPKTMATVNAVVNSSTTTPFMILAKPNTKRAVISILNSNFIFVFYFKFSRLSKTLPFPQKTILDFRHEANGQHKGLL